MSKHFAAAALLGAVFSTIGCTPKTVNTIDVPASGPTQSTVTDWKLGNIANVSAVRKSRAGDFLRVQVDVTNLTNAQQVILYKFVWIDNDGSTTEGAASVWQHAILQGGQMQTLNGIAPLDTIGDCRVQLQRE